MADELGFLKAGPRDVVQIHRAVLKKKTREVVIAKAQAYAEEGRLLALELMGHLVSYYRDNLPQTASSNANKEGAEMNVTNIDRRGKP